MVFVEGSDPASFLSNAIAFANDRLHGTLGANVIIDPASEKALGVNFELLLAELRYGCIAGRLKGKIALSAVLMATVPTGAWAFSFNMPSDWQVSWDNTLTYNLGMRAGGIDPLIGTFRSWRAVVVAVVPLMITSILCEALMVVLGIGVKVATLPVTALGVGIGVDYALYFLSVQLAMQRRGYSLEEAHLSALNFTGKVIALIGVTLAAAVVTWAWSPIKFQADMGILLTFMFLWNMVGALVLIPALSHFLLRDVSTLPSTEKDSGSPGAKSRVASS